MHAVNAPEGQGHQASMPEPNDEPAPLLRECRPRIKSRVDCLSHARFTLHLGAGFEVSVSQSLCWG